MWVLSSGAGLKPIQKVVCYSHDVCATITPVGMSCQTSAHRSLQAAQDKADNGYLLLQKHASQFPLLHKLANTVFQASARLISQCSTIQVCGISITFTLCAITPVPTPTLHLLCFLLFLSYIVTRIHTYKYINTSC